MQVPDLSVKKVKRSFCIMTGVSVLAKFKSENAAKKDLEDNAALYNFWAGSCSVSVENTTPIIKAI